jgi:hypothetical protein
VIMGIRRSGMGRESGAQGTYASIGVPASDRKPGCPEYVSKCRVTVYDGVLFSIGISSGRSGRDAGVQRNRGTFEGGSGRWKATSTIRPEWYGTVDDM